MLVPQRVKGILMRVGQGRQECDDTRVEGRDPSRRRGEQARQGKWWRPCRLSYSCGERAADLFVRLLAKLLLLQEKERAQTANQFRAAPIAQGIPAHQVDEGTQSSNVIDGPFKKGKDRDDTDDDVACTEASGEQHGEGTVGRTGRQTIYESGLAIVGAITRRFR
jgi:hypothetical protein